MADVMQQRGGDELRVGARVLGQLRALQRMGQRADGLVALAFVGGRAVQREPVLDPFEDVGGHG